MCLDRRNKKNVEVPNGMVELGLGIHNEPGFETVPFESASKTIEIALGRDRARALEFGDMKAKKFRIGRWRYRG